MFRRLLLLTQGFRKGGYTRDNACRHEQDGDDAPQNTPTLRGSPVRFCELTRVGAIDLSKNEVVALQVDHGQNSTG